MLKRIVPVSMGWALLLTTAIEARDWGFSKDTIIEWDGLSSHPREDTVSIVNTGDDSLNIDSAWVEVVEPEDYQDYFYLAGIQVTSEQDFPTMYWGEQPGYPDVGDSIPFVWPKDYIWTNEAPIYLADLQVFGLLKDPQIAPESNRLVLRNIFRTKDRGIDTLVTIGSYSTCNPGCPIGIVAPKINKKRRSIPSQSQPYLLNGRRLKSPIP